LARTDLDGAPDGYFAGGSRREEGIKTSQTSEASRQPASASASQATADTGNGINPMQDVWIPKARAFAETCAYSFQDIPRLISVLPEPLSTIVDTTAFTGLRKSEICGLLWEDLRQGALWVTQSVWDRFASEPKTERSKSVIPLIGPLA
jgi:hypothetical protein